MEKTFRRETVEDKDEHLLSNTNYQSNAAFVDIINGNLTNVPEL